LIGVTARHRDLPPDPWRPHLRLVSMRLPRAALYETWHAARWPRVESATGPVDLVHATTLIVPPTSNPLVVTVHDLAFLDDRGQLTSRGNRFMRRGLDLARRHADLVLCSSEATRRDCVDAGLDESRLRVVLLGADAAPSSLDAIAAARARFGLQRPYVAWVGTVEPRKNVGVLLRAFALVAADHPDHELVLIGPPGWGPQADELLAPVDAATRARVRVLGFVGDDDRDAVVAGAAAFCYPSLREGFGLPVLEAMGQGTPVVTSAGTSTAEVAGAAGVLVDPVSPDAIADGLRRVIDDDAFADRLSAAGRARAGELTWERCAEQTFTVYRELVGATAR
ncbi:MAG TPA: glycosyltransferase family 1 protein, partial [Acidimicrobiales bacterium]|nr:glycosyltransferase family 1 protein [Acidimicrobiales bacterium]